MTTTTIKQFRPIRNDIGITKWTDYFKLINFQWILQRIPMLLFAIVSSYGVGHFLYLRDEPLVIAYLGGIAFDIGFLGVIALADQQLQKTRGSTIAYYLLNGVMASLAAVFNILSQSNGRYADITPESITVGAPYALVGLAFAFYYHNVMSQKMTEEIEQQKQNEEYAKMHRYVCECGQGFATNKGRLNHKRTCKSH